MDKSSLVQRYANTPEQKLLLAHVLDLALRAENRNTVETGNFLSDTEAVLVEAMLRAAGISRFLLYGGYRDAERKCPVFLPEYLEEEDLIASPALAEITYAIAERNRFDSAPLSHRDGLGALMALGIEREMIGDIAVTDERVIIILKSSVADYVADNLTAIGRCRVQTTLYPMTEMPEREPLVEMSDTVASMRLDAVLAAVFHLSRSAATEALGRGLVTVNGAEASKADRLVCDGDRLALRGKGRVIIGGVEGLSKKGRVRFTYRK